MEAVSFNPASAIRPMATVLNQSYTSTAGSARQCLDLYVPAGIGPCPVAIWIHGGGWHSCDRGVARIASHFTDHGFALASIGYRLTSGGAPFPAQIEDCIMGVNWLARHAGDFGLDPSRFCFFGHSAGAHLCALVLVSQDRAVFSESLDDTVCVRAAALWSGPLDLSRVRGKWPAGSLVWNAEDNFCRTFFAGGAYDEQVAIWASPASYVSASLPPMLICHGDEDELVPFHQAQAFAEAARLAGADLSFRLESGHDHKMPADIWIQALKYFQEKCQPMP